MADAAPPQLTSAPFFADLAQASDGSEAWWAAAADGTRLRLARLGRGSKGTVLILPGRTEYIEKYGPSGAVLAAQGYGSAAIDWRGQGLADRLLPDRAKGHVGRFQDYQQDMATLMACLPEMGLQGPVHMLAHSMGGAIGLRSVFDEMDIQSAVFSGPMWGIALGPIQPIARVISGLGCALGLGNRFAPSTGPVGYVQRAPFEGNSLTGDAAVYAWMKHHLDVQPDLSLGGPTLHWMDEALRDIAQLRRHAGPKIPVLTFLGAKESIVDAAAIRACMSRWPGTELREVPGAQHEIMMETEARRRAFFAAAVAHFDAA